MSDTSALESANARLQIWAAENGYGSEGPLASWSHPDPIPASTDEKADVAEKLPRQQCCECQRPIHPWEDGCPHCGWPRAGIVRPARQDFAPHFVAGFLVICVAVFMATIRQEFESSGVASRASADTNASPVAHDQRWRRSNSRNLTIIETGRDSAQDSGLEARLASLLVRLNANFSEDETQIADMTVRAQHELRRHGIIVELEKMMSGIDSAVRNRLPQISYAEAAAQYVAFRREGTAHAHAAELLVHVTLSRPLLGQSTATLQSHLDQARAAVLRDGRLGVQKGLATPEQFEEWTRTSY